MKISKRLKINAAAALILFAAVIVLLLHYSQRIQDELNRSALTNELTRETTALIVLTHEFIVKQNARVETQWGYQHSAVNGILASSPDRESWKHIIKDLEQLEHFFIRLSSEIKERDKLKNRDSLEDLQKFNDSIILLSDQVYLTSQRILAESAEISVQSINSIQEFVDKSILVFFAFGAIIVLVSAINALAAVTSIARPLTRLVDQTNRIERSNLESDEAHLVSPELLKKADEMGELSKAFDRMTARLRRAFKDLGLELQERKRAENETRTANLELANLRDLLTGVIDSMPSIMVGVDNHGLVSLWNNEAEKIFGIDAKNALGCKIENVFPQYDIWGGPIEKTVKTQTPFKKTRTPFSAGDKTFVSDVAVFPLAAGDLSGAVIRVDDVSDRVKIDEMLIQSSKMLSVGGLTAGVAHEINNPLAGIMQNVQVVQNRLSPAMKKNRAAAIECGTTIEAISAYLKARGLDYSLKLIMDSGERASQIVQNMLSFTRKSASAILREDLSSILDAAIELAGSDYDLKRKFDFRKIEIIREYDPSVPTVECEYSKVQQVILNLLRNAAHALSKQTRSDGPARIIIRLYSKNGHANIEIEDNGPGMEEHVRSRIFEPFFTTKGVSEGTGLGLFISYFIITNNHRGSMHVESSPGKGAKFTIRIPLQPEKDVRP